MTGFGLNKMVLPEPPSILSEIPCLGLVWESGFGLGSGFKSGFKSGFGLPTRINQEFGPRSDCPHLPTPPENPPYYRPKTSPTSQTTASNGPETNVKCYQSKISNGYYPHDQKNPWFKTVLT